MRAQSIAANNANAWARSLRAAIAMPCILVGLASPAQSNSKQPAITAAESREFLAESLARSIEKDARTTIERHIPSDSFQIFVVATPKASATTELPYLPYTLNPDISDWVSQVDKVEIEVLIASRFGQPTRSKIEAILVKKLALLPARGDKITFADLGIENAPPVTDLERTLTRVEAEARDAKTRVDVLTTEREDAKRDLSLAKNEIDRLIREKATASDNPTKPEAAGESTSLNKEHPGENSPDLAQYFTYIIAAATIILILVVLLGSLILRSAFGLLSNSIQNVAKSLPTIGEKIGEGLSGAGAGPDLAGSNRRTSSSYNLQTEASTGGGLPPLPLEAMHTRIVTLHNELTLALNERTESLILRYLHQLLEEPATLSRAVATMEILGKEKANELYSKLGADEQRLVYVFLSRGHYERPKAEIMLEAGEELTTRLIAESLEGTYGKLNDQVFDRLMRLRLEDYVAIVQQAPKEVLPRLFLYLEPEHLADVLVELHRQDKARFAMVSLLITDMPAMSGATQWDTELLHILDEWLSHARDDKHRQFLSYYKTLLESVDDELSTQLAKTIGSASAGVKAYIRDNIVSLSTFFKIKAATQEEILGGMVNRDIAALLVGLNEQLQAQLNQLLSPGRLELVAEETERLLAAGNRHAQTIHKKAKEALIKRMIAAQGDGPLSDLFASEDEARATPQNSDGRAA